MNSVLTALKFLIVCIALITVFWYLDISSVDKLKSAWATITAIDPEPSFLSQLATFEAVIIGIAVPVSIHVISVVSERYHSEVITRIVVREWRFLLLLVLLVLGIVLAMLLTFLLIPLNQSGYWKLLSWIALVVFFATLILLLMFLSRVIRYVTDPNFLLRRLVNEARKSAKP